MNAATTYALISGRIKASLCDARYISRCRLIHNKLRNVSPNENRAVFIADGTRVRTYWSEYQLMNHANRNFSTVQILLDVFYYMTHD